MLKLESLQTKTNDELIDLIELDVLDHNDDAMARRILKDRLEGLEDAVRVENLKDKIVATQTNHGLHATNCDECSKLTSELRTWITNVGKTTLDVDAVILEALNAFEDADTSGESRMFELKARDTTSNAAQIFWM
jgi:hypothetical protein